MKLSKQAREELQLKALTQAGGLDHWARCLEAHEPESAAAGIVMLHEAAKTLRELTLIIEKGREDQIMIKTKPGTCGAVAEICECIHDKGHNGPHECNCTGAWRGNYNDESFEVISFPNPLISPEYKNN